MLTRFFQEEQAKPPKDGLAAAIAAAADDELIGDVITLARDSRYGWRLGGSSDQNASSLSSINRNELACTCFGSIARFGSTSLAKNRAEATLPS